MVPVPRVRAVAVIGAAGYVGQRVVRDLVTHPDTVERILALDVRPPASMGTHPGLVYEEMDVRSARCGELLAEHGIDTVIHLAAVVNPPAGMRRNEQYAIDVDGTHNVLEACVEHGVRQLVVLSSGAAYGFHVSNPPVVREDHPLRGNEEFPYARHKRLVEELLARYRTLHPELLQLVFRPATILGRGTRNIVTSLFERRVMVRLEDGDAQFGFIWDEDVVACIRRGIGERRAGIYNLAADGTLDAHELAAITGAVVVTLSASTLSTLLAILRWLGFSEQGPEHVPYLRYRPVLSNDALRRDFGFVPSRTSREAFMEWWASRRPDAS